jgi:hypothetical protein
MYFSVLQAIIVVKQATILVKQATILVKQSINITKKAFMMISGRGSNQGIELPK